MNNLVEAEFPHKMESLFTPSRYKILWGGRGGSKSWSIVRALLILAAQKPLRILCTREWMSSMSDSVHRLLSDQIYELGLDQFYDIGKTTITGANGSEFRFAGLKTNVSGLKSFEAIDIAFVEEAANVSKASWNVLIPTIRKEKSEIWISFNPELETDETFQRFVLHPPPDSIKINVNYEDNPYFPEVLRQEMEYLKVTDFNAYLNIWRGEPKVFTEGAVYRNELETATVQNRITNVPYERLKPVFAVFDLGFRDSTSIWFCQIVGGEYRFIDFYENHGLPLDHYLSVLQNKEYIYEVDILPHDAAAKSLGTGRSVEELMREKGRKVRILPRLSIEDGINAARTIFPQCWFDKEKCSDGLNALRKYRYDFEGSLTSNKPIHDEYSHAADSFRYAALALKEPKGKFDMTKIKPKFNYNTQNSWLGR